MKQAAVYVHMPFCLAKCSYCDFNSFQGLDHLLPAYCAALAAELERAARDFGFLAKTVYFGGGTPTIAPAQYLIELLSEIHRWGGRPTEATIEANPGTISLASLIALRRAAFDRLSLGIQSMVDADLRLLGRVHSAAEAVSAVSVARTAGFDNLNIDLIYGLPGQIPADWKDVLERALALEPQHVSLYALTLEPGTPLAAKVHRGELPSPDEDSAADMYELSEALLASAGFHHYEISNWSLPGRECRHNTMYWQNMEYIGLGAGAWSRWGNARWGNVKSPSSYIRQSTDRQRLIEKAERISDAQDMADSMILGLRLVEGMSRSEFLTRYGQPIERTYGKTIDKLVGLDLLENDGDRLRLTKRGRLLGNEVFQQFLIDA